MNKHNNKKIPELPDSLRTNSDVETQLLVHLYRWEEFGGKKSEVSASPRQPAVVGQPQLNDDGAAEEKFSLNPCLLLVHRSLSSPPYRILFKVTGPINTLHHVSVAGDTAGMRVNGEDHI